MKGISLKHISRLVVALLILGAGTTLTSYADFTNARLGWEQFAGVYQPDLDVNENKGNIGSYFVFTGTGYPPNAVATVYSQNQPIGLVTTDGAGNLIFATSSNDAVYTRYFVTAAVDANASATKHVDLEPDEPTWPLPPGYNGPIFSLTDPIPPTPTPTPPPQPVVTDDVSYSVRYSGWLGAQDANAYNGGYRAASSAGQQILHRTAGATDRLALITYRGPDQGRAAVLIDGAFQAIIDNYAPAPQYQRVVLYSGLAPTQHVIQVVVLGQANPASSGTQVRVDGFLAVGGAVDDTSPSVNYSQWAAVAHPQTYGGSARLAASANATLSFQVNGSTFDWITVKCPICGQAEVRVDGVVVANFDGYSPTWQTQQDVTISGLGSGAHNVVVRALGTGNPSSSGTIVFFDGYRSMP